MLDVFWGEVEERGRVWRRAESVRKMSEIGDRTGGAAAAIEGDASALGATVKL